MENINIENIRLLITEKCNANCSNCFNADYRCDKELSLTNVERIASFFSRIGVNTVFVEGGEPTIHSQFKSIMHILQNRFQKVILFTNALSDNILLFSPRSSDGIVYNFNFLDEKFDTKKFLPELPGKRSAMIQISTHTDVKLLISRIRSYGTRFLNSDYSLILTLDCTADIFCYAEELSFKWNQFVASCIVNGWNLKIDHGFPLCIKNKYKCLMVEIYQGNIEDVSVKSGFYWCDYHRAGLIDAQMKLRYCNNFYHEYIPLLENGEVIQPTIIKNFLIEMERKKNDNLPNSCKNCTEFLYGKCNLTCFNCKD